MNRLMSKNQHIMPAGKMTDSMTKKAKRLRLCLFRWCIVMRLFWNDNGTKMNYLAASNRVSIGIFIIAPTGGDLNPRPPPAD
jgi:hypothetical protein